MSASTTTLESEAIAPRNIARIWLPDAIAWAVILLSPAPLLLLHFRRLWIFEHYHYFPFVIAAFAYFTWRRWPTGDRSIRIGRSKTELGLLVTGCVLLAISTFAWSPWFAALAAIFSIGAALVHFAGRHAVAHLSSVWLLLWFLMPIPFNLDVQLIFELQTVASNAASYLLDFLGVNHLLAGHVLEIPRHQFLVKEACSGIQSLFALLAFAAILLIALRRSWIHSAVLLVATVFWATSINVIRVSTVVAAFVWFGIDLATAWKHETLGLLLNGFAILLLFCTDQLILFFVERPEQADEDEFLPDFYDDDPSDLAKQVAENSASSAVQDTSLAEHPSHVHVVVALAAVFGILGAIQSIAMCLKFDARRIAGEASGRLDGAFQASTLPERLGRWKRVAFESESRGMTNIQGARYSAWSYQTENAAAIVHINYPLFGWHKLPNCFKAQGWQIKSIVKTTQESSQSTVDPGVWILELVEPSGGIMQVRFCQFDAFGHAVSPPEEWRLTSWLKTLFDNSAGQWSGLGPDTSTYQVVMQVTIDDGAANVPPEDLTADFLTIRDRIMKTVLERLHKDG